MRNNFKEIKDGGQLSRARHDVTPPHRSQIERSFTKSFAIKRFKFELRFAEASPAEF